MDYLCNSNLGKSTLCPGRLSRKPFFKFNFSFILTLFNQVVSFISRLSFSRETTQQEIFITRQPRSTFSIQHLHCFSLIHTPTYDCIWFSHPLFFNRLINSFHLGPNHMCVWCDTPTHATFSRSLSHTNTHTAAAQGSALGSYCSLWCLEQCVSRVLSMVLFC